MYRQLRIQCPRNPPWRDVWNYVYLSFGRMSPPRALYFPSYINLFDLVSRARYAISHFRFAHSKVVNWAHASHKFTSNITNDISHSVSMKTELWKLRSKSNTNLLDEFIFNWKCQCPKLDVCNSKSGYLQCCLLLNYTGKSRSPLHRWLESLLKFRFCSQARLCNWDRSRRFYGSLHRKKRRMIKWFLWEFHPRKTPAELRSQISRIRHAVYK